MTLVPGLDADVPAPPPGPGVNPPFAAPPVDRSRRGLWIGLGIGGLVLVLCCVGGVFGIVVLGASVTSDLETKGRTVVADYLNALRDEDYSAAYDLRCAEQNNREPRSEFAARQRLAPHPVRYTVGRAQVGNVVVVPATVQFDNAPDAALTFTLVADSGTSELRVCRITG